MQHWNDALFLLVNAAAHPSPVVLGIAVILAESAPIAAPVLLVALWAWGGPTRRDGLLATAGAMLVGQGINQVIGFIWFEPRPFMSGIGHALIAHVPDNSIPSDHATLVWTLGAALIATGAARRWGVAVCIYGVGVAWARVFLGLHFPDDMAVSALVAVACGGLGRAAQPVVRRRVSPLAEHVHEASLHLLRLPPKLIPRREDNRPPLR